MLNEEGDLLDIHPPPMEFTNEEPSIRTFQVPQIQHLDYADSTEQHFRPRLTWRWSIISYEFQECKLLFVFDDK